MQNQTQLVRSAINLFIVIAVVISVFQQLNSLNSQPAMVQPQTVMTAEGQTVPLQPTGPVIPGIKLQATDKYTQQLKQLLAKNKLNVEISSYTFDGNLYWMNMIFNWGHIVLIYFLMTKYKTETNDATKKKIMIGGALAVVAWFYISSQFRPQALAVEVNGSKVYDKDYFDERQVVEVLNEYEIQIDDLNAATATTLGQEKVDAWEQEQNRQQRKVDDEKVKVQSYEDELEAEEIF